MPELPYLGTTWSTKSVCWVFGGGNVGAEDPAGFCAARWRGFGPAWNTSLTPIHAYEPSSACLLARERTWFASRVRSTFRGRALAGDRPYRQTRPILLLVHNRYTANLDSTPRPLSAENFDRTRLSTASVCGRLFARATSRDPARGALDFSRHLARAHTASIISHRPTASLSSPYITHPPPSFAPAPAIAPRRNDLACLQRPQSMPRAPGTALRHPRHPPCPRTRAASAREVSLGVGRRLVGPRGAERGVYYERSRDFADTVNALLRARLLHIVRDPTQELVVSLSTFARRVRRPQLTLPRTVRVKSARRVPQNALPAPRVRRLCFPRRGCLCD